jgi:hypothetical protein
MTNSESTPAPSGDDAGAQVTNQAASKPQFSKILDEVLDQSSPEEAAENSGGKPGRSHKHPVVLDLVLAGGLIFAVGGFTAGLLHMYVNHLAEQSLQRNDYAAAVALLDGMPLPQYFLAAGSESRDLFDKALYWDARERLEKNPSDKTAINELDKIMPGSSFFDSSQEMLTEHFKPSSITLSGGALKVDQVSQADLSRMQKEQQTAQALNDY